MKYTLILNLLSIISFIIGFIVFIRDILLHREYGQFSLDKEYNGNFFIDNVDGPKYQKMKFDLKITKSNVYDINISGIKINEISTKKTKTSHIDENEIITITIISNEIRNITLTFSDKFNNKYEQIVTVNPPSVKNGKFKQFDIHISNRKWIKYILNNSLIKYFK